MRVLDNPLADCGVHFSQRGYATEDAAASIVDDDDLQAHRGVELRSDPRRVHVIDCGQITDDGDVVTFRRAPAEECGELPIDAVRAAVGFVAEAAVVACGEEIPLADRKAVTEIKA